MKETKISVITACYNSAQTIADTMKSVLAQDCANVQHVIVDGGSTDETTDIIRSLEPLYDGRLLWTSERDNGIYYAMNKGIHLAEGNVVGFLNSDDFFTGSDILSTVAREIEGVAAVYGDVHFIEGNDRNRCVRYYSSRSFRPWQMRFGFMPAHPSFYCRKALFETLGYMDTSFRTAADFELLLRFIYINRIKTKYIARDFVTMRQGGTTTSGLGSHRRILSDHLAAYRMHGIRSDIFCELVKYLVKGSDLLFQKIGSRIGIPRIKPGCCLNHKAE